MAGKRVLCVQDLSCVGRCSLAVVLPVLCACGHTACPLPTALLSTHTGGFGTPARTDETSFCRDALEHWAALDLSFDSVYSGYLANAAQAELVRRAFDAFPAAFKLVDPVLGDGGRPYRFVTPELQEAMAGLCRRADLITPNVTESALLLGLDPEDPLSRRDALARAAVLRETFGAAVVLTGVAFAEGGHANVCAGEVGAVCVPYHPVPGQFPGTGDLFSAAVLGTLLRGISLPRSIGRAADFICACAAKAGDDPRFGVPFETQLPRLYKGEETD